MPGLCALLVGLSHCAAPGLIGNREPGQYLPALPDEGIFHPVAAGESLARIAATYQIPLATLMGINDILDPQALPVGDVLFIPGARKVRRVARSMPGVDEHPQLTFDQTLFIWPVKGSVTSRFGVRWGRKHEGIDIGAPIGTQIVAAAAGRVIYSGDEQRGYGNLVIIQHPDHYVTVYAHNSQNLVKEGDVVTRGQAVAQVGQTGHATGPHLHFEIRRGGIPQNPLLLLPAKKDF